MEDKEYSYTELLRMETAFAGQGDTEEWYGWSPFGLKKFNELLQLAADRSEPNAFFLEAGCGIGTKLYRARQLGLWEYGMDINSSFIDHARDVLGVRAYVGSVQDMPYDKADITYLSRPYKDDDKEIEYEKMVHEQIRNGTILIAAWAAVKPPWTILFRTGHHGVWRKPEDGKPVERLPVPPVPQSLTEYNFMIRRRPGHDPLVQEPGPGKQG
jgi:SAM-dependent methyltransferase